MNPTLVFLSTILFLSMFFNSHSKSSSFLKIKNKNKIALKLNHEDYKNESSNNFTNLYPIVDNVYDEIWTDLDTKMDKVNQRFFCSNLTLAIKIQKNLEENLNNLTSQMNEHKDVLRDISKTEYDVNNKLSEIPLENNTSYHHFLTTMHEKYNSYSVKLENLEKQLTRKELQKIRYDLVKKCKGFKEEDETAPSVPVPTVPSVPAPSVPVPSVPSVPAPSVPVPTLPSVPAPSVPVPSVPSVPAPSVPVPTVPSVPTPSVPVPSVPSVPAPSERVPVPTVPSVPAPFLPVPEQTVPVKVLPVSEPAPTDNSSSSSSQSSGSFDFIEVETNTIAKMESELYSKMVTLLKKVQLITSRFIIKI